MTTWVLFGIAIAAFIVLVAWVLRSFTRWGPTDSERRTYFWGRRGGGDL